MIDDVKQRRANNALQGGAGSPAYGDDVLDLCEPRDGSIP